MVDIYIWNQIGGPGGEFPPKGVNFESFDEQSEEL